MGQGYLNANNIPQSQLEAEDYFKYLATHSFSLDFDKDGDGNIISCKMHDLVHDFVKFLTKDRFVTKKVDEDFTLKLSSERARHLRLIIREHRSLPLSICGAEKLQSLVAISHAFKESTSKDLRNLFNQTKHIRLLEFDSFNLDADEMARDIRNLIHLRYLSLESCSGIGNLPEAVCELPNLQSLNLHDCHSLEKLPNGIGKLIHLRYLNLDSCSRIEDSPGAMCELLNLQSLNLQDCCSLEKLPDGIGKLINLRYLCTEGCRSLRYYAKGIGNLTSLIRLSYIKVRADCKDADEFSIGDLEKLDLVGGNLRLRLIGNGIDWDEAKRAELHNKIHLKSLDIDIASKHIKVEEVRQALNPPSSLPVRLVDYYTWFERMRNQYKV